MVRKIALAAALTVAFGMSAYAATAPAAAKWYVEKGTDGKCTAAQSATKPVAPIVLVGSTKGYANQTAANSEIAKLQKVKPTPTCAS